MARLQDTVACLSAAAAVTRGLEGSRLASEQSSLKAFAAIHCVTATTGLLTLAEFSSGFLVPTPTKVKVKLKVTQSCPTLCNPVEYTVHGILQARILECIVFPFCKGSSQTKDRRPKSPALQADSLPAEPQGKPKNTGVGSLSLLQRLFPTQESNGGLLQCRQILYQLSYQGSPTPSKKKKKKVGIPFLHHGTKAKDVLEERKNWRFHNPRGRGGG